MASSNPSAGPSTGQPAAHRYLVTVQQLLSSLPPQQRPAVAAFWAQLRNDINSLEAQNQQLQQAVLQNSNNIPPAVVQVARQASRPSTSDSINVVRIAFQQGLVDEARAVQENEDALERIYDIDPRWAMDRLHARIDDAASDQSELGCWLSSNVASNRAHGSGREGYDPINLRNTVHPSRGGLIGFKVYAHQLAMVAKGSGYELLPTRSGTREEQCEVSHLCHNTRCFNPQHLVVETKRLNNARNSCVGHFEIRCECGATYNPCPHSETQHRRFCYLPTRYMRCGQFHGPRDVVRR